MFEDLFELKNLVDNWVWLLGIPVLIFLFYRGLRDSVTHKDSNVKKTGLRVKWSELWKRK